MLRTAIFLLVACGLASNVAGPHEQGSRNTPTPAVSAEFHSKLNRPPLPRSAPAEVTEAAIIENTPPASVREWFYNHGNLGDISGDCVQVSLGMHGVRCGNFVAACLAYDSEFGPAIRGGSGPKRVADYCRARSISVFNVTSNSIEDTYAWAKWAAKTGRGAAIGFGRGHFQFLCGYDEAKQRWLVCDNNSPWRVDQYTDAEFRALHALSGYWIVIIDGPAPAPPITRILDKPKAKSFWEQLKEYLA